MQLLSFSRLLLFSSLCAVFHLGADKKEAKTMTTDTTSKSAASPKIALVNVHRIITVDPKALPNASDEWRSLYTKLQDTLKPTNAEIEDTEKEYKAKTAELEEMKKKGIAEIEALQKSAVSSKEIIQKKSEALQAALERKYREEVAQREYKLQNMYQHRERFAQSELERAQSIIGQKIEKVLEEIQTSQGWDMILKGDAVLGKVSKKFDITDEVLRALNKRYEAEKAEKAKKEAAAKEAQKQVKG